MTKGNIIDLIMYRNQRRAVSSEKMAPVSEELKAAIDTLIGRLRAAKPIKRKRSGCRRK